MRIRIAAVVCGIALSVIGVPAAPAAAATGTTCANLYVPTLPPVNNTVYARACVTWNDAPSGNRWTQTEQRIWNPPGGVNNNILVTMYDNTGDFNKSTLLYPGGTLVSTSRSVGQSTAKFYVLVHDHSDVPYCMYLTPGGANIEHHDC